MILRKSEGFYLILTNIITLAVITLTVALIFLASEKVPDLSDFPANSVKAEINWIAESRVWTDVKIMIGAYAIMLFSSYLLYRRPQKKGYKSTGVALFASVLNLSLSLVFSITILVYLTKTSIV